MASRRAILFTVVCMVVCFCSGMGTARAQIDVSKPALDFGALTRPNTKSLSVSVTNTSSSPFLGTVDVQGDWLTVTPKDLSLGSGASAKIQFNVDTRNLEPADYEARVYIKDLMGGSKAELTLKCVVVVGKDDPVLKLEPRTIDYKEVEKGSRQMGYVVAENIGSGLLTMKIKYPEWIRGEEEMKLHYTQKRPLYGVAYAYDLLPGEYTDEIKIESNGGNQAIAVHIVVKPKPDDPVLSFEPAELDFGTVKKGKKGRKHLKILNKGKGKVTGTITYPEWIEGEEEFKEVEKTQSFLLVASPGKLPYGITRAVVKIKSDYGLLDVPVKIFVERK